jgi:hypothetical protein
VAKKRRKPKLTPSQKKEIRAEKEYKRELEKTLPKPRATSPKRSSAPSAAQIAARKAGAERLRAAAAYRKSGRNAPPIRVVRKLSRKRNQVDDQILQEVRRRKVLESINRRIGSPNFVKGNPFELH